MPKKEAHISALQDFLPADTYQLVLFYLQHYQVHLTVSKGRKSILGDYRHRTNAKNHRISVNGDLNKYAFLITLLHELAHLLTFEKFGNRISPHGIQWKQIFGQLLARFIEHNIFPQDIKKSLLKSLHNPAASSCSDEDLLRVLKSYDEKETPLVFVEAIPDGSLFKTQDGKIFRKGEKIRKRYQCEEIKTKRVYLFSPVYEAEIMNNE